MRKECAWSWTENNNIAGNTSRITSLFFVVSPHCFCGITSLFFVVSPHCVVGSPHCIVLGWYKCVHALTIFYYYIKPHNVTCLFIRNYSCMYIYIYIQYTCTLPFLVHSPFFSALFQLLGTLRMLPLRMLPGYAVWGREAARVTGTVKSTLGTSESFAKLDISHFDLLTCHAHVDHEKTFSLQMYFEPYLLHVLGLNFAGMNWRRRNASSNWRTHGFFADIWSADSSWVGFGNFLSGHTYSAATRYPESA